jgi:predicted secreted protein
MKLILALALLLGSALPAGAQTVLHLAETARVKVPPDELVASIKASASTSNAAESQSRVNALIAKALAQAKAVPGLIVTTGSYQVWNTRQPEQWTAEQNIDLRGRDGAALLQLTGALQGQGLTLTQLGWRVAPETARIATSEATKIALGNLRARADDASAVLGLRFAAFRDVRLDGTLPMISPAPRAMAAAAMKAAPSAVAEDVEIEATVQAEILLQPLPTQP